MAIPSMGVSHTESLSMVGVAIQAFAYHLNFKHWQDCVLKLLGSSPSLNWVKLYHGSTRSKCFKAVQKTGTTNATWPWQTLLLPGTCITRGGRPGKHGASSCKEEPRGFTFAFMDPRWGAWDPLREKNGGTCVKKATTCLVSWIYPSMIYLNMLYVWWIITWS